jgi:hypothetical protein
MIKFLGIGRFDGKYVIDEMTHRAAPGEWTMEMNVLNNALSLGAIADHLQATPEQVNTNEGTELADGSETSGGGGTPTEPVPETDTLEGAEP